MSFSEHFVSCGYTLRGAQDCQPQAPQRPAAEAHGPKRSQLFSMDEQDSGGVPLPAFSYFHAAGHMGLHWAKAARSTLHCSRSRAPDRPPSSWRLACRATLATLQATRSGM